MSKKKYPSELNTKTVRIGIGAWALLTEISRRASCTIAEALDLALKGHKLEPEPEPELEPAASKSPAQIPMPVFRVTGKPAIRVRPASTIATNGNKKVAFRIKPRGARYD